MTTMVPQVGDYVVLRCRTAEFAAVVRDVTRAAGRSATPVVVRPMQIVPKRLLPAGEVVVLNDAAGKTWRGVIGGSTDKAVGVLLQAQDDGVNLSILRDDLLLKAKLAKHFEKLDEVFSAVFSIARLHQDLTPEEFELTLWCCRSLAQQNCAMLKGLRSEYGAEFPVRVVTDCIAEIEEHLVPFSSLENRARYYKLIGDLAWVCYDFASSDSNRMLAKALSSYEIGVDLLKSGNFPSHNVTLLELILNLSALLHDLLNMHERASCLAWEAITSTGAKSLSLQSKVLLDLIQENLSFWSSNVSPLKMRENLNVPVTTPDHHPVHEEAAVEEGQIAHLQLEDGPLLVPYNVNEDAQQNLAQIEAAAMFDNGNQGHVAPEPLEVGPLLDLQNLNQDVQQNLAQIEAAAMFDNGNQAEVDAGDIDNQQLEDGHLLVPENFNQVAREVLAPFEEPPLDVDLESKGNCFNGKNYRRQRIKKSEMKSKYG